MTTNEQPVFTRADYMAVPVAEQAAAHRRYYGQFVHDFTIAHVVRVIGRERLLASRDPHFNDIPLHLWDALVPGLPLAMPMKRAGDYYSLCGGVCIAKEAARQYIESQQETAP